MHSTIPFRKLLEKFENKQPEIVFHWKDSLSEAEGWTVINSLRGGAAGGGTRMRKGLDKREVESLAKTMEVKFSVCGPPIGGAKSGINFDPADPRKNEVLKRWYAAVYPLLKNYYGTGGDLNVDEIHEVIPITSELGLLHPQEGVVNGHLKVVDIADKAARIDNLQRGVSLKLTDARYSPDINKIYTVADMITGWGVSEAVKHYYELWGGSTHGKTAIIQGWGNVGAAAAWYLARMGVSIIGIIDRNGGLIRPEGISFEEIHQLLIHRKGNSLPDTNLLSFEETQNRIWDLGAEILIPAAASRLLTKEQIEKMCDKGLEVISCGANVPFNDPEIFFGEIATYADSRTSIIPDFIANCGMARVFAYLMHAQAVVSDEAVFEDVSRVIYQGLSKVNSFNPKSTGIAAKALEISLSGLALG